MLELCLIIAFVYWLILFLQNGFEWQDRLFIPYPKQNFSTDENIDSLPDFFTDKGAGFRRRKKPQWVIDKIIYLKAVNPLFGCRKIAELFDRLYAEKRNMTVSKSYVYYTLRNHRYDVQVLRRAIKHRRPKLLKRNICWGIDLTTVTDRHGNLLPVFVAVDYGSRRCIAINGIKSKHSLVLLYCLFKATGRCGKPKSIKTDNEAVFTSLVFKSALVLAGIKHQTSDVASPWQNGRVERLIGTFKEKVRHVLVQDQAHLVYLLPQFQFWYNEIRSHSYLNGKTPMEVWDNVDVFSTGYKRAYWFEDWGGLLTGYYLKT